MAATPKSKSDPITQPAQGDEPLTIGVTEFKQRCLQLLEDLGPGGIVVTKRGRPIARVLREPRSLFDELYGKYRGQIIVDPDDNLFSTGAWVSDEWGDLNNG